MRNGIRILSFMGKGRYSIVMATAAPIRAKKGERKNKPATKAKRNPPNEPSHVFALLKGNGFLEPRPPKIDAMLSPRAKIAIAPLLMDRGNNNNVMSIPTAKYIGAAANDRISV